MTNLPSVNPQQAPSLQSSSASERFQAMMNAMMETFLANLSPVKRFMAKQFMDNVMDDMLEKLAEIDDETIIVIAKKARAMNEILYTIIEEGASDNVKELLADVWGGDNAEDSTNQVQTENQHLLE